MKDYYQILGIEKNANPEQIKKAYRKLAHQYHPDKKGGSEEKFKEINEAYQTLSDPQKRSQYDQFGQTFNGAGGSSGGTGGFSGFENFDFSNFTRGGQGGFEDIFSDIFSDGFGGSRSRTQTGSDIKVDLEISFEEMAKGVEKEIDLYKKTACRACNGTGALNKEVVKCQHCGGSGKVQKTRRTFFGVFNQVTICPFCQGRGKMPKEKCPICGGDGVIRDYEKIKVSIPAGIEDEQTLHFPGMGEAIAGGEAGDLYIVIHVKESNQYFRKGDNIVSEEKINFSEAVLGGKKEIQTIDGLIKIKIPAGIQSGDYLKIKDRGIYSYNGKGRGDHLLKIKIIIPRKINRQQKKIIEQLKEEGI